MRGDIEERVSLELRKQCFPRLDGEGGASQAGGCGAVSWRDHEKNPGGAGAKERERALKEEDMGVH